MRYLCLLLSIGLVFSCSKKESKTDTKWTKDSLEIAKLRDYINEPGNCTSIRWVDGTYKELDSVSAGKTVEVSWKFENSGSKPLIIANVTTSCNCTVVDKPKDKILPGKKGIIKAKFNTNSLQGWHRKDVYVLVNNKSNLIQTLSFAIYIIK